MSESSPIVLPSSEPTEAAPQDVEAVIDEYGNRLVRDPNTGACVIFGTNGCVGFTDANGTSMRTRPDGIIEFTGKGVRFLTDEQPQFLQKPSEQINDRT